MAHKIRFLGKECVELKNNLYFCSVNSGVLQIGNLNRQTKTENNERVF